MFINAEGEQNETAYLSSPWDCWSSRLAGFGCATQPSGSGWVTLIEGDKGLENWNRIGRRHWRVEGGAVVADKGKGGFLVSKDSYKDFEIYAEFWLKPIPTAASSSALPIPRMSPPTTPTK